jgi:hypothetical protein
MRAWKHCTVPPHFEQSKQVEYQFLFPTLSCNECYFPNTNHDVEVGDNNYITANRSMNRWYEGTFISSFLAFAAHYAHLTVSEQLGDSSTADIPLLLQVTFTRQSLQPRQYKPLPAHVKHAIGVMHKSDHYAVMMEINVATKKVLIYDLSKSY